MFSASPSLHPVSPSSHEAFFVPNKNLKNHNKKLKENNGKTNIKLKDKELEISQIKNKIIEEEIDEGNFNNEKNNKILLKKRKRTLSAQKLECKI